MKKSCNHTLDTYIQTYINENPEKLENLIVNSANLNLERLNKKLVESSKEDNKKNFTYQIIYNTPEQKNNPLQTKATDGYPKIYSRRS
jgi:hypothetical protein